MAQLIPERMQAMDKVAHRYLKWENVLNDAGVSEIQDLSGQLLCACPFHEDWSPSFRVVLDKNYYHCFSCGDGGSILKLAYKTSGSGLNKSQYYEQFLKSHRFLQADLGFDSIFLGTKSSKFNNDNHETEQRVRATFNARTHIGGKVPVSTLADKVRSMGDTWDNLVYSLTMLQVGQSPEEILHEIMGRESIVNELKQRDEVKPLSLFDLLDTEDLDD